MNYESIDELDFGLGTAALDTNVIAGESQTDNTIGVVPKTADIGILELPPGCKVVAVERHGISFWAHTGKIDIEKIDIDRIDIDLVSGKPAGLFIKALSGDTGKQMFRSEFGSMKAICNLTPEFTLPR